MKNNFPVALLSVLYLINSCAKNTPKNAQETLPTGTVLACGSFTSNGHQTSGTAKVMQDAAGKKFLLFENFRTENGRHIYTTNTASDNISSYNVHPVTGNISILHSLAATSSGAPIDAALTDNSKYLYILNTAGHTITGYSVSANGALMALPGTITGLPVGANGLAAD